VRRPDAGPSSPDAAPHSRLGPALAIGAGAAAIVAGGLLIALDQDPSPHQRDYYDAAKYGVASLVAGGVVAVVGITLWLRPRASSSSGAAPRSAGPAGSDRSSPRRCCTSMMRTPRPTMSRILHHDVERDPEDHRAAARARQEVHRQGRREPADGSGCHAPASVAIPAALQDKARPDRGGSGAPATRRLRPRGARDPAGIRSPVI